MRVPDFVCVLKYGKKNVFASHWASQCLISASYSAFHLWTLHPPLLPSSSRHCWSVFGVFSNGCRARRN